MDIVDSQVHFNKIGIEAGLAAMDALGIRSLVIDEYEDDYKGRDTKAYAPYVMVGDVARPVAPLAESASRHHPDRLCYMLRVQYNDPDLAALVRLQRQAGVKALRTTAVTSQEIEAFRNGGFRPLFTIAAENDLPLCMTTTEMEGMAAYLDEFRACPVILDHCGLAKTQERYRHLVDFSRYPNLFVKWAHAPKHFESQAYPFIDLHSKLRAVVDAYGAERVMWASDATEAKHSWAEDLFFIKDNPVLSEQEKEWILGKTARKVLKWPAAEAGV